MAEEGFSWLDEDATERLLRGEPADGLPAVGPDDLAAQAQARRLAAALGSVATLSTPAGGKTDDAAYPGEAAALAAFRDARAGAPGTRQTTATADVPAPLADPGTAPAGPSVPAPGGVSIGRKTVPGRRFRLGRPLRAGLTVALAGCALGGVAFAAGANVLAPFDTGRPDHEPRRSASAEVTPSPLTSGEASAGTEHGGPRGNGPGSTAPPSSTEPGSGRDGGSAGSETERGSGEDQRGGVNVPPGVPDTEQSRKAVSALCRQYEAGSLKPDTERRLEDAAGGREAAERYCAKLARDGTAGGTDSGSGGSGDDRSGDQGDTDRDENGEPYETRDVLPPTGDAVSGVEGSAGATQGDGGAGTDAAPDAGSATEPDGTADTDTGTGTGTGSDSDSDSATSTDTGTGTAAGS